MVLTKLEAQLVRRRDGDNWTRTSSEIQKRPPLKVLDAYHRGEPPLPRASQNWAPAMREYLRTGA